VILVYNKDHLWELAYKQVKRWQRPNKHFYTKGHKGELEYKQAKWWQRPLLTCMLAPRINKRIWLTNR
jgi:hypothetical protein